MISSKKREKFLAIITGALVLFAVVYAMLLKPQIEKRSELTKILTQKQIIYTKMQGDFMLKDRIERNYSRMESLLRSNGTDQEEMSAFSQEFQSLNSAFNLKPKTIKFLPMIKNEFYRKILVRVELNGKIQNIIDFIVNVENEKKTMKFEKLNFVAKDRDDYINFSFVLSKVISNASNEEKYNIQKN